MKYNILGKTGLKISEIGFGTVPLGVKDYNEVWDPISDSCISSANDALNTALDLGINLIDTAPMYGDGLSEKIVAKCIKKRRSEFILATKISAPIKGWNDISIAHVENELKNSLVRLETDYIDIYQLHGDTWSPEEAETVLNSEAMGYISNLKKRGVIRYMGVTSESPQSVLPFIKSGLFDTIQIKYNIIYQEAYHSILHLAENLGIGVLLMRPLTSGIFQKSLKVLCEDKIDCNLNEVALKYVLSDSRVDCAIIGMRRSEEVKQNVSLSEGYINRCNLDKLHSRNVEDNDL